VDGGLVGVDGVFVVVVVTLGEGYVLAWTGYKGSVETGLAEWKYSASVEGPELLGGYRVVVVGEAEEIFYVFENVLQFSNADHVLEA